ncbi:MAG: hypothetical protein JXR94_15715 [Candidatus Hydrogenedentes bacterium]|nr:hypothetical protein [Candidatus Hydrogenedentota bacterium]
MNTRIALLPVLCTVAAVASTAQAPAPDARELLACYAATRDELRSYILNSRTDYEYDFVVNVERPDLVGRRTREDLEEFRTDGLRFYYRIEVWGNLFDPMPYTKEKPAYTSYLWDGRTYVQVTHGTDFGDPEDLVHIVPRDHEEVIGFIPVPRAYGGRSAMGFFWADVRVDTILRNAHELHVDPGTALVNGTACYVIRGRSPQGRYMLWLAPEYGSSLVQARVRLAGGDRVGGHVMPAGFEWTCELRNVRLRNIDGTWVPVQSDAFESKRLSSGTFERWHSHCEVTHIVLNPDHDALGSFVPKDIRNGSSVCTSKPGEEFQAYTWQDGELIPRPD